MRSAILQFAAFALAIHSTLCVTGFDISIFSGAVSQSTFECMKNAGMDYTIIQAWNGGYTVNTHFPANIQAAHAAGLQYVDIYCFACPNCAGNTPSIIMATLKKALPSDFNGQLWLDIEPCNGCWGSATDNLNYINSLAEEAKSNGFNVGVYSSIGSWEAVAGSQDANTPLVKSLPLWYAHYDGQPNFDDTSFYQFGGWTKPNMKQYSDAGNSCGLSYDYDWYP